jgi:hypothetical protein
MHELFMQEEFVPVHPGQSPFQVRGVIYERTIEHAKQIAGSLEAFVAELRDERIRAFMTQRFKWTGLYDALPLAPIQITLSRLQGRDFEEATRARAAEGAKQLIPRLFRLVLALTRPRVWANHAPRLMSEYCGFGDVRLGPVTDTSARFDVVLIPRFFAASHAATLAGIFEGTLSLLRAKDIASRYFDVELAGTRDGHTLVSYKLELTWT